MVSKPSTGLLAGVAIGLVVGVLLGNGALAGALTPHHGAGGSDDPYDTPGYSLAMGGPSCYDGPTANAGWVHEVANGDHYGITLNATIVHAPDERVAVNVSERLPNTYEIAIRTTPPDADEDERMQRKLSGCEPSATDINLGTGFPLDYRRAVVSINGRELLSFENEDTSADLYQLPNPVNATASKSTEAAHTSTKSSTTTQSTTDASA